MYLLVFVESTNGLGSLEFPHREFFSRSALFFAEFSRVGNYVKMHQLKILIIERISNV